MFLGNDPLRIWLRAITVSGNALLSCYRVVQTLSSKLFAVTLPLVLWYFMVSHSCYSATVTARCVCVCVCVCVLSVTDSSAPTSVKSQVFKMAGKFKRGFFFLHFLKLISSGILYRTFTSTTFLDSVCNVGDNCSVFVFYWFLSSLNFSCHSFCFFFPFL